MENIGGCGFIVSGCTARKKRSNVPRRPRSDPQTIPESYNTCIGGSDEHHKGQTTDGIGVENKPKKLKLKVGGITHMVQAQSEFVIGGVHSATSSDALQSRQKLILKGKSLQGASLKGSYRGGSGYGKDNFSRGRMSGESTSMNEVYPNEPIRKSKRVPKRRILDAGFGNDDEDEELRYLGRLNASRVTEDFEYGLEGNEKKWGSQKISGSNGMNEGVCADDIESYASPRLSRYARKKLVCDKIFEDNDYVEEEEPTSGDELDNKRKKSRKESLDMFIEGKKEPVPMTRKQTLEASECGGSPIGLPNGLPPPPAKKHKEKLSDVEQQLKRTEAAQRRRVQAEKAAREAEAEAIRKILGQDSGRKKKEEKIKQQQDELAREKAINTCALAANTIRWVMGANKTVVTFSEDIGLPSIFRPVSCSYPAPREKCAGPNCTNEYKYRDSKSKLPLCSLHCYRAIQERTEPLIAC